MSRRAANAQWYNWYANGLLERAVGEVARGLRGDIVLDVGCGVQPYRLLLAGFARYVGFDSPSPSDSGGGADVYGDAAALPFAPSCADAVVCTEVIEHVRDPLTLLEEIRRVLKAGGTLILSVPFTWHIHDEPRDYWRFTEFGLRLLAERAGFAIVSLRPTNGFLGAMLQSRCYFLYYAAGPLRPAARPVVWCLQWIARALGPLDRNRRMTSNYVLVARKA
jgi:SAM-dependent methyltransferase